MTTLSLKHDRKSGGQSRRKQVARSSHAAWHPKMVRRSALELLHRAAHDRLPHLLALKYERMAESPFGYFRGGVPVMAYDLSQQPHTGIFTQLCGDAHVRNLGAFAAPDGTLTFDINDFDETIRGPFEWDVKRLATSLHLAARAAGQPEASCREAVRVFLRRYRKSIHNFAAMPVIELARYGVHRRTELAAISDVFAKAERSTPTHLRDDLTEPAATKLRNGGKPSEQIAKGSDSSKDAAKSKVGAKSRIAAKSRTPEKSLKKADRLFRSDPPLLKRLSGAEAGKVLASLDPYRATIEPERRHLLSRYRSLDVAFKVVGTGSVGLRDYCIYLEGNGLNDPLFLQIKQEVASGWAPYLEDAAPAQHSNRGEGARVVDGQRAMQVQSDPFLGFTKIEGRDYLVRQLNDHKGSVDLDTVDAATLVHYADLCGELLARGHARAGDPDALAGYIGHGAQLDKAIATFARGYADQTEEDWQALRRSRQS